MGLTNAEDEMWKQIRAIISPTFTSRKLKEMFPLIKHHGDILTQNIGKKVAGDEAMNMKEVFGAYNLDIIISTSFGVDSDSINNPDDILLYHVKKLVFSFLSPLFFFIELFLFLVPLLEMMNVTLLPGKELEFFVNVAQRLKEQRQASESENRVDFLQLLIESQATDIPESSEANQFPKAYNLATHPEVQERLQKEIDSALPNKADLTYEVLFHMEYLDVVVNETIWLFPLGGRLERVFKKTVEINGVTIPKGTVVIIPTYVLHQDPEYWSEPEEFCPER
ncbi:cytochrome P450 3A25-like [Dugong dugon]